MMGSNKIINVDSTILNWLLVGYVALLIRPFLGKKARARLNAVLLGAFVGFVLAQFLFNSREESNAVPQIRPNEPPTSDPITSLESVIEEVPVESTARSFWLANCLPTAKREECIGDLLELRELWRFEGKSPRHIFWKTLWQVVNINFYQVSITIRTLFTKKKSID